MKAFNFPRPINRIGFVVFCIGLLMLTVSYLSTADFRYDSVRFASYYKLMESNAREWWQHVFRMGIPVAFVGAWVAWFFDPTLGRVARWIRSGNWRDSK
ncbi:hypothetical protein [Pseudomonas sp. B15(2017)]|uniref:hypothetical protein n=1 Tax=Pseudomonas sp. B15(2017) TaxID=1981744 RepID=UPI000A1E9093|nr:hypothetical protein [Pseudomonas sp. B15(2017)]